MSKLLGLEYCVINSEMNFGAELVLRKPLFFGGRQKMKSFSPFVRLPLTPPWHLRFWGRSWWVGSGRTWRVDPAVREKDEVMTWVLITRELGARGPQSRVKRFITWWSSLLSQFLFPSWDLPSPLIPLSQVLSNSDGVSVNVDVRFLCVFKPIKFTGIQFIWIMKWNDIYQWQPSIDGIRHVRERSRVKCVEAMWRAATRNGLIP